MQDRKLRKDPYTPIPTPVPVPGLVQRLKMNRLKLRIRPHGTVYPLFFLGLGLVKNGIARGVLAKLKRTVLRSTCTKQRNLVIQAHVILLLMNKRVLNSSVDLVSVRRSTIVNERPRVVSVQNHCTPDSKSGVGA